MEYITAQDLYQRIEEALATEAQGVANHILHDTLVLCCHEGLRHTRHAFGNLSSQVDYLCRDRHMAAQDVLAIQRMRRHSNSDEPLSPEDLGYDCRALALFVSAVFQTSVPASLVGRIPATGRAAQGSPISSYTYLRCVVRSFDDETIHATVVNQDCDEEVVTIDYRHTPDYIDFSYLTRILQEGMTLNLLDCHREDERLIPGLIIVEPDYLLDISAIASCFEDYGHHPLLFTLHRLKERQNSKHILLGNFAGSALDDLINHAQYRFADTLQRNFREKAIEYACCPDFDPSEFKRLAESQVSNMQAVVAELFGRYNKEKAILEPSFICEKLGIQSDDDNNYLWNWVAPYYGGWDKIPENIVAAYDTYSCTGLPAGPISNPGLAAIKAALNPEPDEAAKNAYFFVTDLKGSYYYAHTLSEHNANCKTAAAVNKSMNTEK